MASEYAVVSKRGFQRRKRVLYQTQEGAARRFALLTHPRPWEALGQNPDDYACCPGVECGCGGLTHREAHLRFRARLPPLEYAFIEAREVDPWRVVEGAIIEQEASDG